MVLIMRWFYILFINTAVSSDVEWIHFAAATLLSCVWMYACVQHKFIFASFSSLHTPLHYTTAMKIWVCYYSHLARTHSHWMNEFVLLAHSEPYVFCCESRVHVCIRIISFLSMSRPFGCKIFLCVVYKIFEIYRTYLRVQNKVLRRCFFWILTF